MEKESFFLMEKSADQEGRRIITAVASSEAVDRDDEIVTAEAMKNAMPGFMQNPVVLAGHQHRLTDGKSPVIGRVVEWWQEKGKTWVKVEFADTPLALEYYNLYANKFQKAFSIGFNTIPQKITSRTVDGKNVRVHNEIELYELSGVSVPSNREALSKSAKRKKYFVDSKRGGGLYCSDDEGMKALDYLDDFCAGRFDAIPENMLAILKRLDDDVTKVLKALGGDFEGQDDLDFYGLNGSSENAPGCPQNDLYPGPEDGLDGGGLAYAAANETDYAKIITG